MEERGPLFHGAQKQGPAGGPHSLTRPRTRWHLRGRPLRVPPPPADMGRLQRPLVVTRLRSRGHREERRATEPGAGDRARGQRSAVRSPQTTASQSLTPAGKLSPHATPPLLAPPSQTQVIPAFILSLLQDTLSFPQITDSPRKYQNKRDLRDSLVQWLLMQAATGNLPESACWCNVCIRPIGRGEM